MSFIIYLNTEKTIYNKQNGRYMAKIKQTKQQNKCIQNPVKQSSNYIMNHTKMYSRFWDRHLIRLFVPFSKEGKG